MLDKSIFVQQLRLPALKLNAKHCGEMLKNLRQYLLNRPRCKTVHNCEGNADKRIVVLGCKDDEELPMELKKFIENTEAEVTHFDMTLDYDYWTADEVLKKILPSGLDIPSSFETIGHIAHVNLRDEHEPYKSTIGQVLLDKNPNIRTVVNKVGTIENQFRVFNMEVLAGEPNFITQVKQQGCTFRMDYSQVYWNSRLDMEHRRLVETYFKPNDEIWDVFAGIGPFSVPAAKLGCKVFGNDLNPQSTHYLSENAKLNKVTQNLQVSTLDGREFLKQMAEQRTPPNEKGKIHIVMNLPAISVEFLDVLQQRFRADAGWNEGTLPMVHCYQFSKEEDPSKDIHQRICEILGGTPRDEIIHQVRDVAPKKIMMCFSFKLPPQAVLIHSEAQQHKQEQEQQPNKKSKTV